MLVLQIMIKVLAITILEKSLECDINTYAIILKYFLQREWTLKRDVLSKNNSLDV